MEILENVFACGFHGKQFMEHEKTKHKLLLLNKYNYQLKYGLNELFSFLKEREND